MEFGYVRKNLHKLTQLSSQFSPKIRICFRCNTKYSEECFITYPNTSKYVKKTRLRLVFSTHFSVFGCDETRFFVFHILRKIPMETGYRHDGKQTYLIFESTASYKSRYVVVSGLMVAKNGTPNKFVE